MFSLKKPSFLGIDFGMSHIKAVELTFRNERPYLSNYGEVRMSLFSDGEKKASGQVLGPEERMRMLLKLLLRKMSPKSDAAYVAMPGSSGLITSIELPRMDPAELENAVRFEAQRHIPSPLNEVVLSWDIISGEPIVSPDHGTVAAVPDDSSAKLEILLVAALRTEVDRYENYVASGDLKMEMLELETFSLVRSLVSAEDGVCLIIDVGSRSTNLILVDKGFIKVNRNVNAGGHEISMTLAEALNISPERAEIMKSGDRDFLNDKESVVVFPAVELILNEARRILSAHKEKHGSVSVDHLVLSGGASRMKGLDAYFSRALGISSRIGDPWQGISFDERLVSNVAGMGASYSVAVGLAMAGMESYGKG